MRSINRPISPHLTIYNPQVSSIFSIWHRISGVIMFALIAIPTLLSRYLLSPITNLSLINSLVENYIYIYVFPGCLVIISVVFLYHIINGLRHFIWDAVMHINNKNMHKDSGILLFYIFLFTALRFFIGI